MYFEWANYGIVVYYLRSILLNFQWKISKTKPLAANLRRRFEKKMFCGDGCFSALDHLKSKNQIVFVILWVSPGKPVEFFLFLLIFQVLVTLESEKRDFRLKNRSNFYCTIKITTNKKKPDRVYHELYREVIDEFLRGSVQWIWNDSLHRLWKREV